MRICQFDSDMSLGLFLKRSSKINYSYINNTIMIVCPICNKHLKQMHGSHIKTHNMTSEQFKKLYPSISFRNEGTFEKQKLSVKEKTLKDNIRCLSCSKLVEGKYRRHKKFCCSSCSAVYNNNKKKKKQKMCLYCNNAFETKCNHAKYCTTHCSTLAKTKEKVEIVCSNCNTLFKKQKRKIKKSITHFCSNICKQNYFKINSHERGVYKKHNGRSVISTYRKNAFNNYKNECYYCGYDKFIDVLQVHHLDENRKNNSLENLRIVCPTCHSEIHKHYK